VDATPVLKAREVGRSFAGRPALAGVNLEVRGGELLALIGPNGGGKSTLLLILAGLVRPDAGEATLGDRPTHALARAAAGSIGLVTADPGLYPLLTGHENLRWFGGLFGLSSSEVDARSAPLLARLGLSAAMAGRVGAWSSGMRQKLALARALLLRPPALLLDEPTANLDPVAAWEILGAVRAQADAGVAVVLCTHDLGLAERWCDRAIYLDVRVGAELPLNRPEGPPAPGPLLGLFPGVVR
jgi:ABC-2 type transport system ATP-binding protein